MTAAALLLRSSGLGGATLFRSQDAEVKAGARAQRRVLVVDDDHRVRSVTARMLREQGYEVVEAASGREALRTLEQTPVQVVVTDIVMPEMDGLTLANRMVHADPASRIILITGYASEQLKNLGINASPYPLLMKPFTMEQLVEFVEREFRRA